MPGNDSYAMNQACGGSDGSGTVAHEEGLTAVTCAQAHPVGPSGGGVWAMSLISGWADGVRSNLIYRHRFELLVRNARVATDV